MADAPDIPAAPAAVGLTGPAVLLLVCSLVTALCLGALAYTVASGTLPFGLGTLQAPDDQAAAPAGPIAAEAVDSIEPDARPGEAFAHRLYSELNRERQAWIDQRETLDREQQLLDERIRACELREQALADMEARIQDMLDHVSETEMANIRRLGGVLASADPKTASSMVLEMDEDLAARVLYFMDKQTSAPLMDALTKLGPPGTERAADLLRRQHSLSKDEGT